MPQRPGSVKHTIGMDQHHRTHPRDPTRPSTGGCWGAAAGLPAAPHRHKAQAGICWGRRASSHLLHTKSGSIRTSHPEMNTLGWPNCTKVGKCGQYDAPRGVRMASGASGHAFSACRPATAAGGAAGGGRNNTRALGCWRGCRWARRSAGSGRPAPDSARAAGRSWPRTP